ncbi:MAG: hypothetical protein QF486_03305 [Candidatus Woesearchaeota archaeon]|nr:hypothetical protein [Candidatus Woesearchaeota archaeon]MDP7198624.1 hypothetical protein [Candidatus Woesearchaeota archaeon]MDP7466634.1 hypothetical protein [Candidatus Woesearchaeota archaeon]MDP7646890.1 hypothetical protein [Candidatus Woesearchaeota archaeon]
MKQKVKHYNPWLIHGDIVAPKVEEVDLETVCLAGDHIETPTREYIVPEYVITNHNGDCIIGAYDYNNGTVAFVNAQGELHTTAQEGAIPTLKEAGYQEGCINVPYTNPEKGDMYADVLEHRAVHCEYTRKMLVQEFLA